MSKNLSISNKAGIYVRISTISQKDGFGIESQITKCENLALSKGWEVVKIYKDEAISGVKESRPGLNKILEHCGVKFGVVVIKNINRLGRNAQLILKVIEDIQSKGCAVCACEGNIDTSTPIGKFMLHTIAGVAELDRAMIIDRMTAGRNQRALKDGEKGGNMPYGYRRKRTGSCSTIVVNDRQAKIIRRIFKLHSEGLSMREIARRLNRMETDKKVWRHGTISYIIKNRSKYEGCNRGQSSVKWPVILRSQS